jgi:hypothetical protein
MTLKIRLRTCRNFGLSEIYTTEDREIVGEK